MAEARRCETRNKTMKENTVADSFYVHKRQLLVEKF